MVPDVLASMPRGEVPFPIDDEDYDDIDDALQTVQHIEEQRQREEEKRRPRPTISIDASKPKGQQWTVTPPRGYTATDDDLTEWRRQENKLNGVPEPLPVPCVPEFSPAAPPEEDVVMMPESQPDESDEPIVPRHTKRQRIDDDPSDPA